MSLSLLIILVVCTLLITGVSFQKQQQDEQTCAGQPLRHIRPQTHGQQARSFKPPSGFQLSKGLVGTVSIFLRLFLFLCRSALTTSIRSDSKDLLEGPTVVPMERRSKPHLKKNRHDDGKLSSRARTGLPLTRSLSLPFNIKRKA